MFPISWIYQVLLAAWVFLHVVPKAHFSLPHWPTPAYPFWKSPTDILSPRVLLEQPELLRS